MIGKVSPHGQRVTGLIYFLFGPGRHAEHTDPYIVAGWRHPAELEPPLREGGREKMISQIPPNRPRRPARATLAIRGEPELTAPDLARYLESGSGAKGTRTPDPLVANNRQHVHPRPSPQVTVLSRLSKSACVRICCGTSLLYAEACHGTVPRGTTHCTGWPVTPAIRSKSLS